ncbi:MAG TPA: hypothetical protein VGH27_06185 [Streptosporangiaceae bacterium]|jgi:hypothetical protein
MINLTRRAGLAALIVMAAGSGGLALAQPAGHAAVLRPGAQLGTSQAGTSQAGTGSLRPTFQGSVYGDFTLAGNSVLRCPTTGETLLAEHAACVTASQRGEADGSYDDNDLFYLERNAVAAQGLFDAGQARLSIPAGATVQYAQLDWGGNTGHAGLLGLDHLLNTCGDGLWAVLPAQRPPPPAAASPQQQDVQLGFASSTGTRLAQPAAVPPAHVGVSGQTVLGVTTGMYSAYADVTAPVANAVASAAGLAGQSGQAEQAATLNVTVGNVWAMSGHSCTAGWSLVVVFGYPSPPANPANPYRQLREVDVYSGQHTQSGATTSLALPGLNGDVNAADPELGLVAYHGDINHSGPFLVGGQAQNDPCSSDTSGSANFFSACAQGALDPFDPTLPIANNFSVDAKVISPALASAASPPGSSADIAMTGASDPYLLQSVVLSEDINPAIGVSVTGPDQPVHVGQQAGVTVTVSNSGDTPLYDVALAPGPARAQLACPSTQLGTLAPGGGQTLTCTATAGKASFPVRVAATGQYQPGDPQVIVSGLAKTTIPVVAPVVGVTLSASPQVLRAGQPTTLTFTVTNKSVAAEGPVDATISTSPALPGCQPAPVQGLAPGAQVKTTCSVTPAENLTVAAAATAVDPYRATATAAAGPLKIAVIHPAMAITVAPQPDTPQPGQEVNFTVTIHNTGDVSLAGTVTNDVVPACDFSTTGDGLAAGAAQSQKCTVRAPATLGSFTDTASYTARPTGHTASGVPITTTVAAQDSISGQSAGSADVAAAGTHPALEMTVVPQPATVHPGQPVNFTITIHNTGDLPLTATVTNDVVPACDFSTTGDGLAVGAAQSQKCTVRAPSTLGAFADTASYSAQPAGHTGSGLTITGTATGTPIGGHATGTAEVLAPGSTAPLTTSGSGSSASSTSSGGSASAGSPGGTAVTNTGTAASGTNGTAASSGGLSAAGTGAAIGLPLLVGVGALVWWGSSASSRSRRG